MFQLELAINCTWSNVRVRSNKLWMFGSSVADSRVSAGAGGGQQHLCPAVNFRSRGLFLLLSQCSLHSLPPSRTWISTCSPCPRAMASLLSASLTTALSFPSGPTCSRQKTTGTRRTGGSASTSPGTATAPGSPAPAWPRAGPRAGTRECPRWKGESHSATSGGSLGVPHLSSWFIGAASQRSPALLWVTSV